MTDATTPDLPFSSYQGGRFSYLLAEPFTREIWEYLARPANIAKMISAAQSGKPPLLPLLEEVESRFGMHIASDRFPGDDVGVMVNNMIKQIMEYTGYEHVACGMLRHARYIRLSGVYKKRSPTADEDLRA